MGDRAAATQADERSTLLASTSRPTRDPSAWCSRGALVTLAFGAVAATCATTAALRVGLPPMASLHTRGLPWSPPAATSTRLEAPRPLGRAHDPRLASLGAGVDPQVPSPGGGASADRTAAGAGIYQPDWDEIDLGDDFRGGDGDEGEERDTRDMDTFEGAFGDDDGVLTNAPRLRSLDRASRDAEASERAWDAEEGGGGGNWDEEGGEDGATGRVEHAYENGLDARLDSGLDGDAYEESLRGDLDASYADAERAERRRRVMISRQREQARDVYENEKFREAHPESVRRASSSGTRAAPSLGAARRETRMGGAFGVRDGGGGGTRGTKDPDAYFDYDYVPDYLPPPLPLPLPDYDYDYDYGPYDYGPYDYGPYDYAAGTGTRRAGTGTEARRRRGQKRGGTGSTGSAVDSQKRSSRGNSLGTLGDGLHLGVPGLAQHVAYAGDGVGADAGSTRVLVSVLPGEWGLAYLQLASLKRTSPQTLAHITVLTYDRATRAACAALGNGRDAGVDCFLDEAFLETWGDSLDETSEDGVHTKENGALDAALRAALSWRKVHAAFELLQQNTPVVLLDADVVFLKDPIARWRDAMRSYDVTVAALVGDEDEAQRNADTSVVLLPASPKTKELTRAWLKGESIDASNLNAVKGVDEESLLDDPARAYFNYALVPVVAGFARVHGLDARAFANFLTAHRGADGAFDGVVAVSGGFCSTAEAKERFLRSTLEEKARAEKDLAREEAALGTARTRSPDPPGNDSSEWASASARRAARRAARIVERKKARAEKRAKGLPLISSVDTQTHAAAVGVSGGDIGLDAGSDGQSDWPPVAGLACDGAKREAAFRGEYRVTEERSVVWER